MRSKCGAIGAGFWQAIAHPLAGAVVGVDAHARIDGETAPVAPLAHGLGGLRVEPAAALVKTQYPLAHQACDGGDRSAVEPGRRMKAQCPVRALAEYPVDDTDVEVHPRLGTASFGLRSGNRAAQAAPALGQRVELYLW